MIDLYNHTILMVGLKTPKGRRKTHHSLDDGGYASGLEQHLASEAISDDYT